MVLAAREVGCGQASLDVSLFTVCVFLFSYLCIFIFYSYFLYIFYILYFLYLFIYLFLFIYFYLFIFIYLFLFIYFLFSYFLLLVTETRGYCWTHWRTQLMCVHRSCSSMFLVHYKFLTVVLK